MSAIYDIRVIRGYDHSESFTFRNANGTAQDLSGSTFAAEIKTDPEGVTLYDLTVIDTDKASGVIVINFPKNMTGSLVAGTRYYYDLRKITNGVYTQMLVGRIEVGTGISLG